MTKDVMFAIVCIMLTVLWKYLFYVLPSKRRAHIAINELHLTECLSRINRDALSSGGGGMDRIAKLEASVTHIESDISMIWTAITGIQKNMREDFRVGVGITVTVALGLAWLLAKGFHWF